MVETPPVCRGPLLTASANPPVAVSRHAVCHCRRRGKDDEKHYTVFVCSMAAKDKAGWEPQLNHEHFKWRWFPLEKAYTRSDLHPIVKRAFKSSNRKIITESLGL